MIVLRADGSGVQPTVQMYQLGRWVVAGLLCVLGCLAGTSKACAVSLSPGVPPPALGPAGGPETGTLVWSVLYPWCPKRPGSGNLVWDQAFSSEEMFPAPDSSPSGLYACSSELPATIALPSPDEREEGLPSGLGAGHSVLAPTGSTGGRRAPSRGPRRTERVPVPLEGLLIEATAARPPQSSGLAEQAGPLAIDCTQGRIYRPPRG
jgi:hypothetical protein